MNAKICIGGGLIIVIAGVVAAVYYADQIMQQVLRAQTAGTAEPNLDINGAVACSLLVSVGFVLVIIGLVKLKSEKKTIEQ